MFRKAVIVLLTLAGLALALSATWSHQCHRPLGIRLTSAYLGVDGGVAYMEVSAPVEPLVLLGPVHGLGFTWYAERVEVWMGGGGLVRQYRVPSWLPVCLLAVYPVLAFVRSPARRRRQRRQNGLCLACGYDLTGNVSGVCPECGTEVEHR
jgi:hypothetical protein